MRLTRKKFNYYDDRSDERIKKLSNTFLKAFRDGKLGKYSIEPF